MEHGTLKVYCAASMRGGGRFANNLEHIATAVRECGHIPLTEAFAEDSIEVKAEGSGDQWIYDRDMKWLRMSDCLIGEVSSPSLGVGYEIAVALHERGIPVLALCHESIPILSAMLHGNTSPLLTLERYSDLEEMRAMIREFLVKFTDSK